MLRQFPCWIFIATLSVFSVGCYRTQLLKPENSFFNTEKDVVVYLFDGREIEFEQGNYSIVKTDSATILKGKGIVKTIKKKDEDEIFDGEISFVYIENMTTKTYPIGSNSLLSIVLSPIAAIATTIILVLVFR